MIGLTTLPCFGAGKVSSDSFSQGFKGLCPIRYFVARRMERFTGISRGQWSSSQIFLVQSRVYAINLLFATVVLVPIGGWAHGPACHYSQHDDPRRPDCRLAVCAFLAG